MRASFSARLPAVLFLAIFMAVVVAACGSNSQQGFQSPDGGMTSSSSGGGSGSSGSSGGGIHDGGLIGEAGGKDSGTPIPPKGCDTSCTTAGGKCQNNVCVIVENPGGVDPGTIAKLGGGGSADPTFKWLYPYDATVFPRGLLPPTLQLAGTSADALYVRMTSASLDYKGYFKPMSGPIRQALSAASWTAVVEATSGLPDKLAVQITKISAGQVTGPLSESWPVAQGSLKGAIYYETYASTLQTNMGALGGVGIMQISPGATTPTVLKSGCGNVCHTASADGSTLVASVGQFDVPSSAYDLKNGALQITAANDERYSYMGLYPDGTFGMSATNFRLWIPSSTSASRLYDTQNGQNTTIPANGWDNTITNAGTPAFSPDGKQIAFIREDAPGNGHVISKMDFTVANKSFSGLADLATDNATMLGWPSFTPDGKWVTYQAEVPGTCMSGSSTTTAGPFETDCNSHADLFISDVASHTVHRLDQADGYSGAGTASYLPAGDPDLNFAPTVLPEAAGGYYWVIFTSHRAYGNVLASMAPGSDGTPDELGQLWVAAVDQNGVAGKDPSHPAFYLDGQEVAANNLRGFWVLPPCKAQGASCISGDECCQGFCRPAGDSGARQCIPPPGGCSNDDEKCTSASDCCNTTDQCINGLCALAPAQ